MGTDLESSKSLGELMLDLALLAGLEEYGSDGAGAPTLPEGEADLALLKRWLNQGYRRFLRSDPHWTFCIEPVRLTLSSDGTGPLNIEGDPARYRLPFPVRSRPRGNWRFVDATTSAAQVLDYAPRRVELMRQANPGSGIPEYAGCRRSNVAGGIGQSRIAWEVVFYPDPSSALVVEADFRIPPYDLVELDEHHIAGADHDEAIVASAWDLWQTEDADESDEATRAGEAWKAALAASQALDRHNRPRVFGRLVDPSISPAEPSRRGEGLVTQVGSTVLE